MTTVRYINRVAVGIIMFIPFFVIFVPMFKWMDWAFEDEKEDCVTQSITDSFWKLFKR